jgi:hypothetical protein
MGRSQPSMTCCRARGKVTAVGDGKKTGGRLFEWAIPNLRNYVFAGELQSRQGRLPYFVNSRLIKTADEFKDKTTAINQLWQTDFTPTRMTAATATQNSLPSDFILAYAPASEGQSLQGSRHSTAIAG